MDDNIALIPLTHGKVAIVDRDYVHVLRKFAWRAVKAKHNWYAKTEMGYGKNCKSISMHRFVARTPFGQICHHIDRNSLHNRRHNLVNMEKSRHTAEHTMNNLQIKFSS